MHSKPTRVETLLFWLGAAAWLSLYVGITQLRVTTPQDLMTPRPGIPFDLAVQIAAVAAANFTAIFPAFVRRSVRGNRLASLVWLVSIAVASLTDLVLLAGLVRLAFSGPIFPPG
jgi:hypothetical protein